jgi:hypothetical protein
MFTKLISFVCVLTLALAATSYGSYFQGDLVPPDNAFLLGNWEMVGPHQDWAEVGSFDNWIISNNHEALVGHRQTGATLDNDALKLIVPTGWQQGIMLRLHKLDLTDDFFNYDTFEMDVTVLGSDWTGWDGTYAGIQVVINSDGLWHPLNEAGGGDTLSLDPTLYGDSAHGVWSYAHLFDGDEENGEISPDYTYLEIVLIGNCGGHTDYTGDASYYLDRAVLTPEPATIALLGLGALSLIRRKR